MKIDSTSIFEPCTKRMQYRAGNNDGKWRKIEADDRLSINGFEGNYIWNVVAKDNSVDYDDRPMEVYMGFVIAANDYGHVWKIMCKHDDLNKIDYDNLEWVITLVGTDLTNEGERIISTSYRSTPY